MNTQQYVWFDSCSGHFSGGGCPAAGLPFNPDCSQQVAEWTWGGRGQCRWTCVCLCVCVSIWKIHFSLTSTQAVCAVFEKSLKTLIHEFAPLVTQLCELIGQIFSAYPQASALDLTRQVKTRSNPSRKTKLCLLHKLSVIMCLCLTYFPLVSSHFWLWEGSFYSNHCPFRADYKHHHVHFSAR